VSTTAYVIGAWEIDVPIDTEEMRADKDLLAQIQLPAGAILRDMEVVIHGRVWHYRSFIEKVAGR